jgi:ribosomal protein S18 acetylase RimI-like enzyme
VRWNGHALRAIELHEARAHAHGEREVRDLGDAILLTDPTETDPFLNRLSGLRLPSDDAACDARLAELYALFAGLGRRPHVWAWPGVSTPADLEQRLLDDGFVELGGTFAMVLDGRPAPALLPVGARLERAASAGERERDVLAGAARVMVEAFGAVAGSAEHVVVDLARAPAPRWDVCVAWLADEPVAAGRRYTADGMTHLSSIATRPRWWGRGFAAAVTAALADDGQQAGGALVHLGVEAQNARARRLYERLGFTVVGERIADLLL